MQNDAHAAFIESARALKRRAVPQPALHVPPVDSERRVRSLQTCHRYAATEHAPRPLPRTSNGYVPELAARVDDDPNLCDGARRCARKIAELTYRQNREGRTLPVTVTYLATALGRCRRTVQRYLRQLEQAGYIAVDIVTSTRTRLCVGLFVKLLEPIFAGHHKARWPGTLGNAGATRASRNQSPRVKLIAEGERIPVLNWATRSMNGVFDALMKTKPLAGLPAVDSL
jgi:hypothetical protein